MEISPENIVYCYVSLTDFHPLVRFKEHIRAKYLRLGDTLVDFENKESVSTLHQTHGGILQLMTQEALWIYKIKQFDKHQGQVQRSTCFP